MITQDLIAAMRTEKQAREALSQIDWHGVVDLLTYCGLTLSCYEQNALVTPATDRLNTPIILGIRNVLSHIGDKVGNSSAIIATLTREIVGLTGAAMSLQDAASRLEK